VLSCAWPETGAQTADGSRLRDVQPHVGPAQGVRQCAQGGCAVRARQALSRTEVSGGVSKYQALHDLGAPPVPGLDALEKRAVPRMLALANAYFNDTVYSGYTVLRIASHDIPFKDYISGMWHHDRCGRRIKCFVFLTNTTARAHPLRIALGSYRTIFYSYDSFEVCAVPGSQRMAQPRGSSSALLQESRFADEYVRREYKVKTLLGSRAHEQSEQEVDGFCFNTNSIHAGTLNGSQTRDAVVFEFNQYAKSVGLSSIGSPMSRSHLQYWTREVARRLGRITSPRGTWTCRSPPALHGRPGPPA
jgi:hypothetical protein